ncbi:MAG: phosphoribosylglycinamide synthetase C domain-containing protein, partial [Oscillospiraceae bacterium]
INFTDVEDLADTIIYHAGTKSENGKIVTSGGRVLGVTAIGDDLKSAIDKAYIGTKKISFDGAFYRNDIGAKALKILE